MIFHPPSSSLENCEDFKKMDNCGLLGTPTPTHTHPPSMGGGPTPQLGMLGNYIFRLLTKVSVFWNWSYPPHHHPTTTSGFLSVASIFSKAWQALSGLTCGCSKYLLYFFQRVLKNIYIMLLSHSNI